MENLECGCRPGTDTPVLFTGNRHNQSVIDGLPKMGLTVPAQGFDWLVIYQEGLGLPLRIKQFETVEGSVDFLDEQIERNLARDLHAATRNGRVG